MRLYKAIAIEMAMYAYGAKLYNSKRKLLYLHGAHTIFQQVTVKWKS